MPKKSKLLLILFLLLIVNTCSPTSWGSIGTKSKINEEYQLVFQSIVNELHNSSYYILVEEEKTLEFAIKVETWGNEKDSGTTGLLIQLFTDNISNSTPMEAWLVPRNDYKEHYFVTTESLSGVYKISFSPYGITEASFSWALKDNRTIWTYESTIASNNYTSYFTIERSVNSYVEISTIILHLHSLKKQQSELSVRIIDEQGKELISSKIVKHYIPRLIELNSTLEFRTGQWYKILFSSDGEIISPIYYKLYYERFKEENVARIFLNKSSMKYVPIDSEHAWMKWHKTSNDTNVTDPLVNPEIELMRIVLYLSLTVATTVGISIIIWLVWKANRRRQGTTITVTLENELKGSYKQKLLLDQSEPAPKAFYKPTELQMMEIQKPKNYVLEARAPKKVRCSICYQIIANSNDIIRCPVCDMAYHKKHLYEWLVAKGTCPICKASLKIKKLKF